VDRLAYSPESTDSPGQSPYPNSFTGMSALGRKRTLRHMIGREVCIWAWPMINV
jgi:hypothetical protein